jgi:hypothetical protein
VAVGHPRLGARVGDKLGIATAMPEGQGEHAHQRPISVCVLIGWASLKGWRPAAEVAEGPRGLNADVEDAATDGIFPPVVPGEQTTAEVIGIEPAALEKRGE